MTIKKTCAIAAALGFGTLAFARSQMNLNGDWHYIVDPQDMGRKGYHADPGGDGDNLLFARNIKRTRPDKLVEYDFAASPTLKVPGDWNTQRKELFYYEGVLWYERDFEWKRQPGRTFLRFDAVSQDAAVYLNGKKLGDHSGGFTPFEFDVTDLVRDGENFVVVRVDNTRRRAAIPAPGFDWWNYGGIIRDVYLETRPDLFIASWRVDLDRKDRRTLHAEVSLDKPLPGVKVKVSIPELSLSVEAATDGNGTASLSMPSTSMSLWSPESPKLYKVTVSAADDEVFDEMGFRTIETKGRKILLNGEALFLKGVCMHDEAPDGGGRVATDAHVAENIRRAKSIGANFVRLAHYPHNEKTVRACERAGLLVWSEIPLYWMIDWANPATYANAESQLREMIARDIRRGNVIIWSLANETVPGEARDAFLRRLLVCARSLDSTRLVTIATDSLSSKGGKYHLTDNIVGEFDIVACNEYIGWYRGLKEAETTPWELPVEKPFVISEFGGGSVAGKHGSANERFTEEMHQAIFETNVRMFARIDGLVGVMPWVLTDYRSPRRPLAGIQEGYNRKGLFSPEGREKLAAETMRRFYKTK